MNPTQYKCLIKGKTRDSAYIILKETQADHDKGRSTHHENLLKPQEYLLTSKITNKQKSFVIQLTL